jgi:hypothetical protein
MFKKGLNVNSAENLIMETFAEFILGVIGVGLASFGGLVMFSDKFLARMRRSLWKKTDTDRDFPLVFSEAESKSFDRYGRGAGALTAGLILIALLLLKHFK